MNINFFPKRILIVAFLLILFLIITYKFCSQILNHRTNCIDTIFYFENVAQNLKFVELARNFCGK